MTVLYQQPSGREKSYLEFPHEIITRPTILVRKAGHRRVDPCSRVFKKEIQVVMNDMEIILNSQSGTGCIFGEEVFCDLQNIRLKMIVKNDLQSFINFLQRKATRTK